MASYHCTVKAGASAGAAAHDAYIEREGKYGNRDDLEVAESGNLPAWASSSADFWKASDQYERANAKGYQEYEVALPRELPSAARLELVRAFVRQELGERHTYSFAIHTPKAALEGGEQPHAHIMFSDRHLDGIERPMEQHFKRYNAKNPHKGGCRKGEGAMTGEERTAQLLGIRGRWAKMQNEHLERHGATARVDHRSLKAQGIDRVPEQHLGPKRIENQTPAVEAVLQARSDRTLATVLSNAIAAAQRRLARLQAVAREVIKRAARKPDLVSPPPPPPKPVVDPLVERDKKENACAQLVQLWDQHVQVERVGYLKELTSNALRDLTQQMDAHKDHSKARPILWGRKEWEAKLALMDDKTHRARLRYDELKDDRFPFLERDREAVQQEAEKRAQLKYPKVQGAQKPAQEILLARNKRLQAERMEKLIAERAAKKPQRDRGISR